MLHPRPAPSPHLSDTSLRRYGGQETREVVGARYPRPRCLSGLWRGLWALGVMERIRPAVRADRTIHEVKRVVGACATVDYCRHAISPFKKVARRSAAPGQPPASRAVNGLARGPRRSPTATALHAWHPATAPGAAGVGGSMPAGKNESPSPPTTLSEHSGGGEGRPPQAGGQVVMVSQNTRTPRCAFPREGKS
jgi:hypothetical protein